MKPTIESLTTQIKTLYSGIVNRDRGTDTDRVECGKLLMQLRDEFGNAGGSRSHKSTFCQHLEKQKINLGSAYCWIALAEGRKPAYQQHRDYVMRYVVVIRKAEKNAAKVHALRGLCDYVVEKFDIEATVSITGE